MPSPAQVLPLLRLAVPLALVLSVGAAPRAAAQDCGDRDHARPGVDERDDDEDEDDEHEDREDDDEDDEGRDDREDDDAGGVRLRVRVDRHEGRAWIERCDRRGWRGGFDHGPDRGFGRGYARRGRSGLDLDVALLMNGAYDDARVDDVDVPQIALPPDPADPLPEHALGATVRQSRAQLTFHRSAVEPLGGAAVAGVLDVDFFGGRRAPGSSRDTPVPRLRRAFAVADWGGVALLAGQASPPVAAVSPSSVAAVGVPDFASAGNLWVWHPQIRLTGLVSAGRYHRHGLRIGLEAAALAPSAGSVDDPFFPGASTGPDRAERSARPALEGRVLARWDDRDGDPDDAPELSIGGHLGWLAVAGGDEAVSRAAVASLRLPFGRWLELRGEAFTGQALAGLGGGVGQSLGPGGIPVRSDGGWAQLNLHPTRAFELGGGMGIDDPRDADLPAGLATARLRNRAIEGHLIWRPRPLVVGVEVRDLRTRYATLGDVSATHVNLGVGAEF